jgi:glucose 1-dehydrogenase
VHLLLRSLAQEVAPDRSRGNAIAPGANRTRINRPARKRRHAYDRLLALDPDGPHWRTYRRLPPSDASEDVVGTTLCIDGGTTIYPGFAGNG